MRRFIVALLVTAFPAIAFAQDAPVGKCESEKPILMTIRFAKGTPVVARRNTTNKDSVESCLAEVQVRVYYRTEPRDLGTFDKEALSQVYKRDRAIVTVHCEVVNTPHNYRLAKVSVSAVHPDGNAAACTGMKEIYDKAERPRQ